MEDDRPIHYCSVGLGLKIEYLNMKIFVGRSSRNPEIKRQADERLERLKRHLDVCCECDEGD